MLQCGTWSYHTRRNNYILISYSFCFFFNVHRIGHQAISQIVWSLVTQSNIFSLSKTLQRRSPSQRGEEGRGPGKEQPPTLVTMQAVAKPIPRVLISRHTCELTQVREPALWRRVGACLLRRLAVGSLGLSWVLGCISSPSPGSQRRAANRRLWFCPEAFCLMDAICCLNVQFLIGPLKDREFPVCACPS